jgi:hypothetical protein
MTLTIVQLAELNDKTVHEPESGMDAERKLWASMRYYPSMCMKTMRTSVKSLSG